MIFNSEQRAELWYTLRSNKRRSIVTSIGVFAGMFFFTVLISLGTGLSNSAKSQMEGISSDMVFFWPGKTTMPYQGYKANRQIDLTYRDYEILSATNNLFRTVNCFTAYSTSKNSWENVSVTLDGLSRNVFVAAISPGYNEDVAKNVVLYGRDLRREELESATAVCVIGEKVAERFVEDNVSSAVGQYLLIHGIPFQVVGVVQPLTDAFSVGFNQAYSVQVPLAYSVKNNPDKGVFVTGAPLPGVTVEEAKAEFFNIIQRHHNVHPEDTEALGTMTMGSFTNLFSMMFKGIDILIWIVGMGTLFTGVIGVSNILLVTVRERQREIGVRRALGAKPADIRAQFLAEAIAIIVLAGTIGIFAGLLVALGIGALSESVPKIASYILRPYPSPGVLLFSVVIMLFAGVLAGLLPVYKALQIKAIDAIRDE